MLIVDGKLTYLLSLYFFFHNSPFLFFHLSILFKGKHIVIGNFKLSYLILLFLLFHCHTFNVKILLFFFLEIYLCAKLVKFLNFKNVLFFNLFLSFFDIFLIFFLFLFKVFNSIFDGLLPRACRTNALAHTLGILNTLILLARARADYRMLLVFSKCAHSGALR